MIWVFSECELDEQLYQLRRRGVPVKLEPKVFDVLLHLVRGRQRVVSKDELLDALWPGEHVSESVLPRCIAAARRALGDDRGRQSVIQTVHGRGYRLVAEVMARSPSGPPVTPRPPEPPTGRGSFVGRGAAMDRLETALQDALAGGGRVVLVVGEPGIGKTRILEEFGAEVRRCGARWLAARCHEGEGAPAFWPWSQILGAMLAAEEGSVLARDLEPFAAQVATLASKRGEGAPSLPTPESTDPAQARFALFETVTRSLLRAARRQPLALALDDLHGADADSLQLFEFLAEHTRGAPLLLVGSYRDVEVRRAHPLARVLGALARHDHCERVTLRGLERDAVAAVFEGVAGVRPAPAMLDAVVEMTEGNPFFVRELVQLLAEEGRAADSGAKGLPLALPQGARDAIGRRLDSLSTECNDLLRVAAVLGREFSLPLLETVVDRSAEALLELLGEALAGHVLAEAPGQTLRFSFRHALFRQALYDELSVPQRVALHRRVAEALEAAFGARPDAPAAELAHHFFASAPSGTAPEALRWATVAAEHSHGLCAYEESARHYERAIEALDLAAPADEARRCELLIALGEELWTAGAQDRAAPPLERATDLARRQGRADLLARAAIAAHGLGRLGVAAEPRTLALLEEVRESLGEAQPILRARVLARLAGTPPHAASMVAREGLSAEAWRLAQGAGDRAALLDAVGARYWATLGPDRIDERLAVANEAIALAGRFGDRRFELTGREIAIGAHLLRGNLRDADHELGRYEVVAEALRHPSFLFLARVMRASRRIDAGDFAGAEVDMREALERGRGVAPHAPMLFAAQGAWLAFQRGEWQRLAAALTAAVPLFVEQQVPSLELFLRLLPLLAGAASGGGTEELRELVPHVASEFEARERDEHWLLLAALLAFVAFELRDPELASRLHAVLLPYRQLMVSHDLLRTVFASAESVLGLLAAAGGQTDDGVAHLEAGLARELSLGLRPVALRTRVILADLMGRRGAPGDSPRAMSLRREAAGETAALGCELPPMPGWAWTR